MDKKRRGFLKGIGAIAGIGVVSAATIGEGKELLDKSDDGVPTGPDEQGRFQAVLYVDPMQVSLNDLLSPLQATLPCAVKIVRPREEYWGTGPALQWIIPPPDYPREGYRRIKRTVNTFDKRDLDEMGSSLRGTGEWTEEDFSSE